MWIRLDSSIREVRVKVRGGTRLLPTVWEVRAKTSVVTSSHSDHVWAQESGLDWGASAINSKEASVRPGQRDRISCWTTINQKHTLTWVVHTTALQAWSTGKLYTLVSVEQTSIYIYLFTNDFKAAAGRCEVMHDFIETKRPEWWREKKSAVFWLTN